MKNIILMGLISLVVACATPTEPVLPQEDYSLVVFGETGTALEGTLGTQVSRAPFDGRTGNRQFPDSLKLSEKQLDSIKVLRAKFVEDNKEQLAVLRQVFQRARAAREAGATREYILNILMEARAIIETLRPRVKKLHEDIFSVFTPAQQAWIASRRPPTGR